MEGLDHVDEEDTLGFDGYMWEPEYSDSELPSEETVAIGESDELAPSTHLSNVTSSSESETDENATQKDTVKENWCRCGQCPADTKHKKCCWDYPDDRLHPDGKCLAELEDFRQVCLLPVVLTLAAQSMVHRRETGSRMPDQLSNR